MSPERVPIESKGVTASVVIPVFNRAAPLENCIAGLARQTYRDFEVVLVDDASTDDTPRVVAALRVRHPGLRFKLLRNERNLGANESRNRGIRASEGRYVVFIDSDCVPRDDWLQQLLTGFESDRVASVQGLIESPEPTNIYELTYKGTNRVHGDESPGRLAAGNLAVRRDFLLANPLDEDRKYGCDEEGLFLKLKASGLEQRLVPSAVVRHEHFFDGTRFFRQAFLGGRAAAWLVYKYHLPPRLDLLPFILGYITLPLILVNRSLALAPALFLAAALAAITYNDLFRKGKTLWETLISFPMLLVYYHVRLAGYLSETIRLRLGRNDIQRVRLTSRARPAIDTPPD